MGVRKLYRPVGCSLPQIHHFLDAHIAKDAVMQLARMLLAEKSEKDEDIANANALIGKMGLRSAALPKQTAATAHKHRIMMAKVFAPQPAFAGGLHIFAQPQIGIRRARSCARQNRVGWNWKAERAAINNWRRTTA